MFVLSTQGNAMYRAVAMLLTLALAIWMLNIQGFVQAASLTSVSNTLSDSDRGVVSNHTIRFTIPAGSSVANGAAFTVTFPAGFNISTSTVNFTDIDVATSTGNFTLHSDCTTSDDIGVGIAGQVVTFTFCPGDGGLLAAGDTVTIEIGTHATTEETGDQRVTNPSPAVSTSYEFTIATPADSGQTRVVILDDVVVSANVATQFDFTVTGFNVSGVNVNGTSTTGTSSATALPYGLLTSRNIETLAQRLNVTSNARNGFVVTVFQSSGFNSTTGADIDSFTYDTYINTPTTWVRPVTSIVDEKTWGHWGLTSSDDLNTNEFGNNLWVAASSTPRQVFAATTSADGTTANIGSTTVGYQVEITSLQEAADDYTTTLTYIATPTF
jgi:hypothetical protein